VHAPPWPLTYKSRWPYVVPKEDLNQIAEEALREYVRVMRRV